MRLAVVSDIHGNARALASVIEDIAAQGADAVVCLGDIVSGPLDPAGVAEIVRGLGWLTVRGNHDRWLVERAPDALDPVDRFARARLAPDALGWLEGLPASAVFGDEILLCHGTPRSDTEVWLDNYVHERRTVLPDEASVARHAEGLDFPLFLCGHTHMPRAVRLRDGRAIVNPGSVGLQFVIGSPDARYALLDRDGAHWAVSLRSVSYDHMGAAREAEANGFPAWRDALAFGWAGPEGLF